MFDCNKLLLFIRILLASLMPKNLYMFVIDLDDDSLYNFVSSFLEDLFKKH